MNIFPVERSYKISAELCKDVMSEIIVCMLHILDLFYQDRSFFKIIFPHHFFKFITHFEYRFSNVLKQCKKHPVLGEEYF